jgi:hypothetical protein
MTQPAQLSETSLLLLGTPFGTSTATPSVAYYVERGVIHWAQPPTGLQARREDAPGPTNGYAELVAPGGDRARERLNGSLVDLARVIDPNAPERRLTTGTTETDLLHKSLVFMDSRGFALEVPLTAGGALPTVNPAEVTLHTYGQEPRTFREELALRIGSASHDAAVPSSMPGVRDLLRSVLGNVMRKTIEAQQAGLRAAPEFPVLSPTEYVKFAQQVGGVHAAEVLRRGDGIIAPVATRDDAPGAAPAAPAAPAGAGLDGERQVRAQRGSALAVNDAGELWERSLDSGQWHRPEPGTGLLVVDPARNWAWAPGPQGRWQPVDPRSPATHIADMTGTVYVRSPDDLRPHAEFLADPAKALAMPQPTHFDSRGQEHVLTGDGWAPKRPVPTPSTPGWGAAPGFGQGAVAPDRPRELGERPGGPQFPGHGVPLQPGGIGDAPKL